MTLTATPAAGAAFASWSEDCAGTNPTCTLSMTQDRVAKANFLPGQLLTVQKYAETRGLGTVTSSPARLDCGPTCQGSQGSFVRNSNVTLTGECLKFGVRAGESLRESPPMTSKKKTDSALFRPEASAPEGVARSAPRSRQRGRSSLAASPRF